MEDPKQHHVPPGWITEFVPPSGGWPVLCRGWHEETEELWFIGVYIRANPDLNCVTCSAAISDGDIDGRWVVRHDITEPEFVVAWTPIPGYPYSQSFKERLAEKGYPIYPHVAASSDGMAIEMKAPGYAVIDLLPLREWLRNSALAERSIELSTDRSMWQAK